MGLWDGQRQSNMLDGGAHYYDTYQCADGKWISIGSIEPKFYALLEDKLPAAFPENALRVDKEHRHLRIHGDLSLD